MKKNTAQFFIVIYDDDDCIKIPMSLDKECEGALSCSTDDETAAAFVDLKAAKQAIRISTAYARLCKAQGKVANEDFLPPCIKHVKIMKCGIDRAKRDENEKHSTR